MALSDSGNDDRSAGYFYWRGAGCDGLLLGRRSGVLCESLMGVVFLNTEVYPIDYVPVDLRWTDVVAICITALILNLVATVYPAVRASRMAPAQELSYE